MIREPFDLRGRYRDRLQASDGALIADRGWRPNLIVQTAGQVVAGLLKGDLAEHRLYLAVGAQAQDPAPGITALAEEVARVAIEPAALVYVDAEDQPVDGPSGRLKIEAVLSMPVLRAAAERIQALGGQGLEEFGLLLAASDDDPGRLINYVRHDLIALQPDMELHRTVVLALAPSVPAVDAAPAFDPDVAPDVGLGQQSAAILHQVSDAFIGTVRSAGVEIGTIAALAAAPPAPPAGLSSANQRNYLIRRGRARAILQTAGLVDDVAGLRDQSIEAILDAAPDALAAQVGSLTHEAAVRLQGQLELVAGMLKSSTVDDVSLEQLVGDRPAPEPAPPSPVVTDHGVDVTGAEDCSGTLQRVLDELGEGATLRFPGGTYRVDIPVVIRASAVTLDLGGATIDASNLQTRPSSLLGERRAPFVFEGTLGPEMPVRADLPSGGTIVNVSDLDPDLGPGEHCLISSAAVLPPNAGRAIEEHQQLWSRVSAIAGDQLTLSEPALEAFSAEDTPVVRRGDLLHGPRVLGGHILCGPGSSAGVQLAACHSAVVQDLRVEDATHTGVELMLCVDSVVRRCGVETSRGFPARTGIGVRVVRSHGCGVTDCTLNQLEAAAEVATSHLITVARNACRSANLVLATSGHLQIIDNTLHRGMIRLGAHHTEIAGNHLYPEAHVSDCPHGIEATGVADRGHVTIRGNTIRFPVAPRLTPAERGQIGYALRYGLLGTEFVSFVGNTVENAADGAIFWSGSEDRRARNLLIAQNRFQRIERLGINADRCERVSCVGNRIQGDALPDSIGIHMWAHSPREGEPPEPLLHRDHVICDNLTTGVTFGSILWRRSRVSYTGNVMGEGVGTAYYGDDWGAAIHDVAWAGNIPERK